MTAQVVRISAISRLDLSQNLEIKVGTWWTRIAKAARGPRFISARHRC